MHVRVVASEANKLWSGEYSAPPAALSFPNALTSEVRRPSQS